MQQLPPNFIDTLISYAIDPTQWEAFAQELEKTGSALTHLDPTALLATLSQAEALAWQLGSQPETAINGAGCIFYLLDTHGAVMQMSDSTDSLQDYCKLADGGALMFTSRVSQNSFRDALASLRKGIQRQVLVELKSKQPYSRYGYLVSASDLPAALNLGKDDIKFGFLVAHADSSEQAHSVLQSSFNLTNAEIAVCQQLSSGLKLKDVATSLTISTNTARNHLQSIFDKTSINRQGELILMMTQLSVILSVISNHGAQQPETSSTSDYPGYRFAIVDRNTRPRRVAFRRYGNGPRHVVYCHESAGSSRLPPGTDTLASHLGLTIIAPERPGSAFSDPMEGYDFQSTAADLETVVNELGIEKLSILGFLAGAGHAISAAARLGSRVQQMLLIAGRGPSGFPISDTSSIAVLRRRLTQQPWLLAAFLNILRSRANPDINRRLLMRLYGAVAHDRYLFERRPEILEHMIGYTLECLTVSSSGILGEILCAIDPVAVDLTKITAPVTAWHGDQDKLADFDVLAVELQHLKLTSRIFNGSGSLLIYEYWDEVLRFFAADATQAVSA